MFVIEFGDLFLWACGGTVRCIACLGLAMWSPHFLEAFDVHFKTEYPSFGTGLDDARNTARVCARMVSDGCLLKITKSIHEKVSMWWFFWAPLPTAFAVSIYIWLSTLWLTLVLPSCKPTQLPKPLLITQYCYKQLQLPASIDRYSSPIQSHTSSQYAVPPRYRNYWTTE